MTIRPNAVARIFEIQDETFPKVFTRVHLNAVLYAAAQTMSQIHYPYHGINAQNIYATIPDAILKHKTFALYLGLCLLNYIQQRKVMIGIDGMVQPKTLSLAKRRIHHSRIRKGHAISNASKARMKDNQKWIMQNYQKISDSLNNSGITHTQDSIIAGTYTVDLYFHLMDLLCVIKTSLQECNDVAIYSNRLLTAEASVNEFIMHFIVELMNAGIDWETEMQKEEHKIFCDLFGRKVLGS